MEVISGCFFEIFSQLERNTLHARYKRRALVEYFNTLIEGCCRGEQADPQKVSREAIVAIVRFHQKSLEDNGSVCRMGKYHHILYIGLKLCFDWQLKDTATVGALLDSIYYCEKSFERIWIGALFGIRAPHFVAGWKSDFEDQEENLRAAVYFLDHANNAGLEYLYEEKELVRFIDIPIESCGKASPLSIALQLGLSDKLHILLRFGAQIRENDAAVEGLLDKLNEGKRKYAYNLVDCLRFLLRVLPSIRLDSDEECPQESNMQRDLILSRFPFLVEDGIIPISRCGLQPPDLKHLCRCSIRHRLWQNHQLPNGIRMLPVPASLRKYLDLLMD